MKLGRFETNNIYNEDCYKAIKDLPDKCVDLVYIDPPYEFVANGGGGAFGSRNRDYHAEYSKLGRDEHRREGLKIMSNVISMDKNINSLCAGFDYSLLDELDRVLKNINIYIWCNKNQISSLMKHYEEKGCNVELLVWCKTNPIPTCNNKYLSDIEYCVFAREKNCKVYGNYETKSKWHVSGANVDDKELFEHPTIKPLDFVKNHIINSTKENDIVLDCFMGSGTTAVACKELNRQFIGFEIDPTYHQISLDRLKGITKEDRKKREIGQQSLDLFEEQL